ncbi:MAG: hypothetical protein IJF78_14675 [Clostridia bacterium]|nr:hypothetical protein [Clostridia bacterium]
MASIRRNRDIVSIKRTIWSNFDQFRTLGVFYLERNQVLARIASLPDETIAEIAAECREGGVRWKNFPDYLNRTETALLGGCEIIDLSRTAEKALTTATGQEIPGLIRIIDDPAGVKAAFNLTGTYDVLAKGNRSGTFEVSSMGITPETEFTLVNELLPFWEDRYSVALKSEAFSIALSAENPGTGKKGSACIKIHVIEDGKIIIDDLGKYMDTSMLTLWITP